MTWLDELRLDTVIVHVAEGPSMKGIVQVVHDDALVLRDALLYHESDAQEQLGGLQVIPRERVLFIQSL